MAHFDRFGDLSQPRKGNESNPVSRKVSQTNLSPSVSRASKAKNNNLNKPLARVSSAAFDETSQNMSAYA